jgi:signal recognition particle subunit SRP54
MGDQMDGMQMDEGEMEGMEAIIQSMTPAERADPTILEANRRRRIARGSGTEPEDVSGLVKSFQMAAGMMKQMAGLGTRDRMKFAQQMGQAGMMGMTPRFKVKQRSHRLTKKEREKAKKKKKRR